MDWWSRFTIYSLALITAAFIGRIYYFGRQLRIARDKGIEYVPYDLESHRLSVIGAACFTVALLFVIEWMQGQLWFLADVLHVPRVIPQPNAHAWILIPHIPIAIATAAMFAVIALRYTGLRDRLRHRKLVYVCLGLIMITGLFGSVLLASY